MIKITREFPETNLVIREDLIRIAAENLQWEDLRNKTILISGGGGFLAAYLIKSILAIDCLYKLNIKIICVVRNIKSLETRLLAYSDMKNLLTVQHDISLPLPSNFPSADIIIHSASQASPRYYGIDPVGTLLANSTGTAYLLEHAVKNKTDRFLFFSSSEVYGVPIDSNSLLVEQACGFLDPMKLRSCYAESKRMGETMCVAWAHQHNLHTSIVRPFHTYGPGMLLNDGRVFSDFVADVVAKRDIILKSDGLARRAFCYIADATIGFLTVLLKGDKSEAYNIGNPNAEISIKELAVVIANLFPERGISLQFKIPEDNNLYLPSSTLRASPSIDKVKNLGWHPMIDLKNGFSRTIQSFLIR